MSETIKIRDIKANPGEKSYGFLDVGKTSATKVQIPVAIVNGNTPGPKLCLTAGVHCTEYEGIEAVTRIFQETNPENLKGTLIICPVINTPGFQYETHYVNPLDGQNMNRMYPGNPDGTISQKMIYVVYNELIRLCEYHIDAHGGEPVEDHGIYVICSTGTGTKEVDNKSLEMARYYLTDYIRVSSEGRGNSSSEVPKLGIPSITPEAGGLAAYQDEAIQFHYRGIKNVMKWLGMLPGPPEPPKSNLKKVEVSITLKVKHGGVFFPRFRQGESFKKGDLMAEVKDLFGNVLEEIIAPEDGIVSLLFPKRVKISGETAYLIWPKDKLVSL